MDKGSMSQNNAKYSVRSLEKALDLLEYLESVGTPLGVRHIESETGMPKSTAQRLLEVLERRGYVKKQAGRYSLWIGAVPLSRSFLKGDILVRASDHILRSLTDISSETTSLYVRQGFDRILIHRVESPHPLRFSTPIGERLPLHLGASGQALCTGMSDTELMEYFSKVEPVRLADGTELNRFELLQRVQNVRTCGYAVGVAERYKEVTSVAAPVITPTEGVIAAINIVGPTSRMDSVNMERLLIEIRGAAAELSVRVSAGF